eukprot:gb/GFBE01009719.1/.p1 GENE.gb/GFBE01009719.1/~~gb/GFBE01009719.1/.p1  ORF type:complete len:362 (+),score=39.74 gb/GFBE01009719.1/:1-1086(+)
MLARARRERRGHASAGLPSRPGRARTAGAAGAVVLISLSLVSYRQWAQGSGSDSSLDDRSFSLPSGRHATTQLQDRATSATSASAGLSRRDLFSGAIGLLPAFLSAAGAQPAQAQIIIDEPCRCCEKDWCIQTCTEEDTGVATKCDCYEYLSELSSRRKSMKGGGKYILPRDAQRARLDSMDAGTGETGWADNLRWKSASLPLWIPEDGSGLTKQASTISAGAGDGLFAKKSLPKHTVLPPYQGAPLSVADIKRMRSTPAMDYVWCPMQEEPLLNLTDTQLQQVSDAGAATTFCIDGQQAVEKNPARFINAARKKEQCPKVNVEICEFGQVAYFRTTKAVPRGAELVTDYGPEYWEDFAGC